MCFFSQQCFSSGFITHLISLLINQEVKFLISKNVVFPAEAGLLNVNALIIEDEYAKYQGSKSLREAHTRSE